VGVDHGIAAHFEREGLGAAWDAEGVDVNGDAAFCLGLHIGGEACGDGPVDGDVQDFCAVEVRREDDGAGFVWEALDDPFALKGAEVAHGCGLAGELEVPLDLPGGGHEAMFALVSPQIFQQLCLSLSEVVFTFGVKRHVRPNNRMRVQVLQAIVLISQKRCIMRHEIDFADDDGPFCGPGFRGNEEG